MFAWLIFWFDFTALHTFTRGNEACSIRRSSLNRRPIKSWKRVRDHISDEIPVGDPVGANLFPRDLKRVQLEPEILKRKTVRRIYHIYVSAATAITKQNITLTKRLQIAEAPIQIQLRNNFDMEHANRQNKQRFHVQTCKFRSLLNLWKNPLQIVFRGTAN